MRGLTIKHGTAKSHLVILTTLSVSSANLARRRSMRCHAQFYTETKLIKTHKTTEYCCVQRADGRRNWLWQCSIESIARHGTSSKRENYSNIYENHRPTPKPSWRAMAADDLLIDCRQLSCNNTPHSQLFLRKTTTTTCYNCVKLGGNSGSVEWSELPFSNLQV
jgi:hypothetical protein